MKHDHLKYEGMIALAFTLGLMVLFISLGSIRYEANDDMAVISLVKGLFGLTPSAEGVFISPFLGGTLFFLYKFFPAVSWFSLLLYIGLVLACFSGCMTILMTIRSVGGKIAGLTGVAFFICLIAMQISFAAVSLLLWVTGCIFLLHAVRRNLPKNLWFWLAAAQLAAAYLLRPSLLPLFLLVAVPLFLTLVLRGERRVALYTLTPLIVVLILSLLSGMVIRSGDAYTKYEEFNKVRSEFTDTSRSFYNALTPLAVFQAGWSADDYNVSQNWWLYDSTFFSTEKIKLFLENNSEASSVFDIEFAKENFVIYIVYFSIIIMWLFVVFFSNKLRANREINIIYACIFVFLISVVLVLMGIRFPPRISFPLFFMLFLNSTTIFGDTGKDASSLFLKITPPLIFVIFMAYVFTPIASQKMDEIKKIKDEKTYMEQSLEVVLQMNGTDSIIVDVNPHVLPNTALPFRENDPQLKTRVMPGGWLVGAPVYFDFLQREGLGDGSNTVAAMIDNRRLVFRFWDAPRLPFNEYVEKYFLKYLRQRYTVPGSDRTIELKILKDHRQRGLGLIYFQLVTVPDQPSDFLQ